MESTTLRITARHDLCAEQDYDFVAGRRLVERPHGDQSRPRFCDGVRLLVGKITVLCGRPCRVYVYDGSVFELRDVPTDFAAHHSCPDWMVERVEPTTVRTRLKRMLQRAHAEDETDWERFHRRHVFWSNVGFGLLLILFAIHSALTIIDIFYY